MEQSIVIGMTDSTAGRRALDWAAERAAERASRLELLTVIGGALGAIGEEAIVEESIRLATATLEHEAESLRQKSLNVDTRVERGDPVDVLIDASLVFDLVVIGVDHDPSRPGSHRGLHSTRIVSGAHCPVAVVPAVVTPSDRHGVVVGVDGSLPGRRALEFAITEAERTGEPLTVVSTWQPVPLPVTMPAYPLDYLGGAQKLAEEGVEEALSEQLPQHPGFELRRVVERGFPAHRINELARTARLAVVGSHGRGAIARFLLGSTSQSVLDDISAVTIVVK